MDNKTLFAVITVGYVALWVGTAIASIGQLPSDCGEPFGKSLPFMVASLMIPQAVFAYLWGKKSNN